MDINKEYQKALEFEQTYKASTVGLGYFLVAIAALPLLIYFLEDPQFYSDESVYFRVSIAGAFYYLWFVTKFLSGRITDNMFESERAGKVIAYDYIRELYPELTLKAREIAVARLKAWPGKSDE